MKMSDAYNATSTGLSAMSSFTVWPLGLIAVSVILIAILLTALSSAWFKRLSKAFGLVGKSILYFIKGALTVGAGYLIYWLVEFAGKAGSEIPPEYYAYAIGGYIGCSLIGWIATKVYNKIKEQKKKSKRR
jgi:hypothetical protein